MKNINYYWFNILLKNVKFLFVDGNRFSKKNEGIRSQGKLQ